METLHEFESEFLAKLQTEQQTDPTLSATRLFKRLDKVRALPVRWWRGAGQRWNPRAEACAR